MSVYDWSYLFKGLTQTLLLSLITIALSIPLAIILGLIRSIRNRHPVIVAIQYLIGAYVFVVRGTPLMLQLMFVFFGLPFMGINLSSFTSGIIALSSYSIAYMTEVVRTGVESIGQTQWDGASSLGFNYLQTMRHIVLPQAVRIMLAPSVSFFIGLIKDSSLCAVIGIVELSRAGRVIVERTHEALFIFSVVATMYFVICYPLARFSKYVERRLTY